MANYIKYKVKKGKVAIKLDKKDSEGIIKSIDRWLNVKKPKIQVMESTNGRILLEFDSKILKNSFDIRNFCCRICGDMIGDKYSIIGELSIKDNCIGLSIIDEHCSKRTRKFLTYMKDTKGKGIIKYKKLKKKKKET